MNYDQYKAAFDRDGYIIVRSFLDAKEFTELNRQLDRYIREVVPTLPDQHAFYLDKSRPDTLKQMQHMGVDPYFRDYTKHPKWVGLSKALLGEDVEVQEPEWFNKPPASESPTPPHQDNYYFNLKPPQVLTIWCALDPVTDDNGCLRYVPGSHKKGIRPHGRSNILGFSQGITDYGPADQAAEVSIHLQPGDAVIHHGEMIHRAEPNRTSDRNRRAFAMVVRGVSCRHDKEADQRYRQALKDQHEKMGLKT